MFLRTSITNEDWTEELILTELDPVSCSSRTREKDTGHTV